LIEAGPNTPPFFRGGLLVDLEEVLGRKVEVVEERALMDLAAAAEAAQRGEDDKM